MTARHHRLTAAFLADAVERTRAAAVGDRVEPLEVALRDGSRARIRPIRPSDKEGLRRGLTWLSPRSRQLGFHHALERLSDEQLRYVTEIDHRDHVAWVGMDPDSPDAPGIAIARYVRTQHLPLVAEAAITVVDAYQGRGFGTILLGVLAAVAADNGIEVFRNYVLADNEPVLALFDQLGATRQPLTRDVFEVDLPLPHDLEELADTPIGRSLSTVATHSEGPHLALTLPPLWLGRRRARRDAPEHDPEWSRLRERGPFAEWLDAALEDPAHDEPAGEDEG